MKQKFPAHAPGMTLHAVSAIYYLLHLACLTTGNKFGMFEDAQKVLELKRLEPRAAWKKKYTRELRRVGACMVDPSTDG